MPRIRSENLIMIYRMSGCSLNPAEHPLQKLHKKSKHVRHPEALGRMADRRISGSRVSPFTGAPGPQRLRTEAAKLDSSDPDFLELD
uniref:Uncharacterized protein n=1 Tax=Knipowitschia caucasica TaxID=637954 RepID=A0AAV2LD91_KNICA